MMKKIVAAVLFGSIAGVAAAQSSVTLYGLMDVGFAQRNGGNYEGGNSSIQVANNANYTSEWGLKGTEDLGGGLHANFDLEQGFKPLTGAAASSGTQFDRQAWLGLSGGFGQFRLGRQASVVDQVLGQYDLNGGPNMGSSYGNVGLQAIYDAAYGTRRSSQVQYWTPNIDGFSAQTAFISKDDITLSNPDNVYQVGANYRMGGFSAGAAYESKHADQPGLGANWGAGAKYDFGPVVVSANFYNNAIKADGRGYGAGFMVPIGVAMNIGAQAAYNTSARAASWEFFSNYNLSKSTSLYLLYSGMDHKAVIYSDAEKSNSFAIGMIKKF
ncbi:porin [Paraburkholderia sediminicola]|uniref:porin n=1 Tax=Paraburkholderia sediminicola TaxID=458836 RepID=UPI000E74F78D